MVVEHVDIAHRAEEMAPIQVRELGSPLASDQPGAAARNKQTRKSVNVKIL